MSSSQSSFTPSPKRRRQLAADPWKAPLQGSPDRLAWDVSKVPRMLVDALTPKSTIETKLRSSNTLRRATESADKRGRDKLRKDAPKLVEALCAIALSVDASVSGARIRVHCMLAMINLMGEEESFDEFVAFSEDVSVVLLEALRDAHTIVVSAGAQLLRKISEADDVSHYIVINDEWFSALLHLLETVNEESINPHLLSALINVAGNAKGQFPMARCARLLQILVELAFEAKNEPHRAIQAAKCCANLLAFPDNCAEMKRLAPSLVNGMLECSEAAAAGLERESSSVGSTSSAAVAAATSREEVYGELKDVSRLVLEELHNKDLLSIHSQLNAELAQGRAVATRMRSHILSPHALRADQMQHRADDDWVSAIIGDGSPTAVGAGASGRQPTASSIPFNNTGGMSGSMAGGSEFLGGRGSSYAPAPAPGSGMGTELRFNKLPYSQDYGNVMPSPVAYGGAQPL